MNVAYKPMLLSPTQVELDNLMITKAVQFDCVVVGQPCQLKFLPNKPSTVFTTALELKVNQQAVYVLLDDAWFVAYLGLLGTDAEMTKLPEPLQTGVYQASFYELLLGCCSSIFPDYPVTLSSVVKIERPANDQWPGNTVAFDAMLYLNKQQYCFRLCLGSMSAQKQIAFLNEQPSRLLRLSTEIPVLIRFEIGATYLPLKDLYSIQGNDVILSSDVQPGVYIRLSKKLVLLGKFLTSDGNLSLLEALSSNKSCSQLIMEAEVEDEQYFEEDDADQLSQEVDSETGLTSRLAELPVRLTFELDRQEVTVGQLMEISEGYVFNLNQPLHSPVSIRANGKLVGKASIVQVGEGRLGVRVLSISAE